MADSPQPDDPAKQAASEGAHNRSDSLESGKSTQATTGSVSTASTQANRQQITAQPDGREKKEDRAKEVDVYAQDREAEQRERERERRMEDQRGGTTRDNGGGRRERDDEDTDDDDEEDSLEKHSFSHSHPHAGAHRHPHEAPLYPAKGNSLLEEMDFFHTPFQPKTWGYMCFCLLALPTGLLYAVLSLPVCLLGVVTLPGKRESIYHYGMDRKGGHTTNNELHF